METKTKFIGIDFSKATFDATIYEGEHCKFANDDQGFKEFLAWVGQEYAGKRVVAVGHGIINKAIQSVYYDKPMNELRPMGNAEVRRLAL